MNYKNLMLRLSSAVLMTVVVAMPTHATSIDQQHYTWDELNSEIACRLASNKYGEDFEMKYTPEELMEKEPFLLDNFKSSREWTKRKCDTVLKTILGEDYKTNAKPEDIQREFSRIYEECMKQNQEKKVKELQDRNEYNNEIEQRRLKDQERAAVIKFTYSVIEKFENENLDPFKASVINALKKLKSIKFEIEAVAAMQGGIDALVDLVWGPDIISIEGIDETYAPAEQLVCELAQRKIQQNVEKAKQAAITVRSKGYPIDEVAKMQNCKATLQFMIKSVK